MHLSKKDKSWPFKKKMKARTICTDVFFLLVMWNYNVIIFLHSSFWSKFWCLEDDILSILNIRPNPRLCVFWWEWLYNLKTGSRFKNHSEKCVFSLGHQSQGTFRRCWCCCWWCCSRRCTQSGSFTYATVFLFCDASLSSTLPWKRWDEFKSWTSCLMPYKRPHFQVFFVA